MKRCRLVGKRSSAAAGDASLAADFVKWGPCSLSRAQATSIAS